MNDPRLQAFLDKQEIRDVLARYCRGIDRLDSDLIASVYHEDAYDDHGTFKGNGKEFAKSVVVGLARFERTMHTIANCLIEVDGDTATAETYCIAYHRTKAADGPQEDFLAGVRYIDRLERRSEGGPWLIARRVVVMEWTRFDPIVRQWEATDAFTRGVRDRTDLVYG